MSEVQTADQQKLQDFETGMKQTLFEAGALDGSTPVEVSAEENALGNFESAEPYKGESLSSDEAQVAQEKADKVRYKRGSRLGALNNQISELMHANQELAQKLDYNTKFFSEELERVAREKDREARKAHEIEKHSLKVKKDYLVNALIEAKEVGDYKAEAKIQESLMKLQVDLSTADLRAPSRANPSAYVERYNPPAVEKSAPIREEYAEWLDNNPWFSKDSPHYNPDLAQEAIDGARELNKYLQLNQMTHMIDTKDYYDALDDLVKSKYNINESRGNRVNDDEEILEDFPRNKAARVVAPVNRSGQGTADRIPVSGGATVYLSAEEKEMALAQKKTHPNGTPYSEKELLQHRAQLKQRLAEHDKQYGIPNNPHKTTLRFG